MKNQEVSPRLMGGQLLCFADAEHYKVAFAVTETVLVNVREIFCVRTRTLGRVVHVSIHEHMWTSVHSVSQQLQHAWYVNLNW